MKGKIVFVLGAAVGYVLGTRAGRERYEQIKRGAQRVWNTEPVQQGVHLVKDAVDERAEELKDFALRFGGDLVSTIVRGRSSDDAFKTAHEDAPKPASTGTGTAKKSSAQKAQTAKKSTPAKKPAASTQKSGGSTKSGGSRSKS